MGNIGGWEILLLLLVVLLVFGPKRLPGIGRSLGRGMREFRDSVTGPAREIKESVGIEPRQLKESLIGLRNEDLDLKEGPPPVRGELPPGSDPGADEPGVSQPAATESQTPQ